jgi:exonuclease SbcC
MIPLELRMHNFMCYRNPDPLHLEGINLACLVGANGHGKSAILDAMTWALWGKARSRRDDELIHLGQTEMDVELIFSLGEARFRILRKRDASGRGRSDLDFQVASNGDWTSIAESTLRATQAKIIRVLRMDYDTFVHSAFLRQGQADAFTTKTPAERKQVLASILNLSVYDKLEESAKERARAADRRAAELAASLHEMERELAREPEYREELDQAQVQVSDLHQAMRSAEEELRDLRTQLQTLEHQQTRLRDLERRLARSQQEVQDLESRRQAQSQRLEQYEAVLAGREQVEESFRALTQARSEEATWGEKLQEIVRLQQALQQTEQAIYEARRELDKHRGRLAERMRSLEARATSASQHQHSLQQVRRRLEVLAELGVQREATTTEAGTVAEEIASLGATNESLRTEMNDIQVRLSDLKATQEAECPLCRQPLPPEERAQVLDQLQREGRALGDQYRANQTRRQELTARLEQLRADQTALDRQLAELPSLQRREAQLDAALTEAAEAADALGACRAEVAEVEARLAEGEDAPEARAQQAALQAKLDAVGYDVEAHNKVRSQVQDLAPYEAAHQQLQVAQERIDEVRQSLTDLGAQRARWEELLRAEEEQCKALRQALTGLPNLQAQVAAQATERDAIQARLARARQALGAAQQKLDYCKYLSEERRQRQEEHTAALEQKAIYDELRLAFGKRGIQAMIIEAAIPEIEDEANRLLARMTDGRMHVRLESQRETKKGDLIETLDIVIADELGTRPYENYSGGEQYRINFALRIALSTLLARRAGARLQTLVIDEGFGSQDAQGRDRLVEAITSIQHDFEQILVITHIDELKDAFPVRIEVTKTENGSTVRVV